MVAASDADATVLLSLKGTASQSGDLIKAGNNDLSSVYFKVASDGVTTAAGLTSTAAVTVTGALTATGSSTSAGEKGSLVPTVPPGPVLSSCLRSTTEAGDSHVVPSRAIPADASFPFFLAQA